MAITRWSPYTPSPTWRPLAEFDTLRREIDRVFNTFWPGSAVAPTAAMFGNGDTPRTRRAPRVDVRELDHAFVVEADLPGMRREDITVSLGNNTLVIAGDWKATWSNDEGRPMHRELSYGAFQCTLTLPTLVSADQVEAKYTNGVLTVTIPKAAEARTRRIAIQAA